jgi:hypothetical protein
MAVPEDGVGGLFGVTEYVVVGAAATSFDSVESVDLVLCGTTRSLLMLVIGILWCNWRVDFFIFVGVSRVCSSHSTHGVFSPALVGGRLILVGWCCVGFAPVVLVLARFSVN